MKPRMSLGGAAIVALLAATTVSAQVASSDFAPEGEAPVWTGPIDAVLIDNPDGHPYVIVGDRHFILFRDTRIVAGVNRVGPQTLKPGMEVTVTEGERHEGVTPTALRVDIQRAETR